MVTLALLLRCLLGLLLRLLAWLGFLRVGVVMLLKSMLTIRFHSMLLVCLSPSSLCLCYS
jgi:hypothetical protein